MLETVVLLAFVGALAVCVVSGASVLYALAAGYLIFCAYGLKKAIRPARFCPCPSPVYAP